CSSPPPSARPTAPPGPRSVPFVSNAIVRSRPSASFTHGPAPHRGAVTGGCPSVVVAQRALQATIGAVRLALEHVAARHLAAVDVQGHGDGVVTGIRDAVVLVGRNQAPGAADARDVGVARLEAKDVAGAADELVLLHVDAADPDALHAPHAGVVVDRRALPGAPGHDHDRVVALAVAVHQAPRVVVGDAAGECGGQVDAAGAQETAQVGFDGFHGL